jgi:uncharacterized membrane protein
MYTISWSHVHLYKFCIHLRSLNVRHFVMVEATGLKNCGVEVVFNGIILRGHKDRRTEIQCGFLVILTFLFKETSLKHTSTSRSTNRQISHILLNPNVHYRVYKSPLVSVLGQINSIHIGAHFPLRSISFCVIYFYVSQVVSSRILRYEYFEGAVNKQGYCMTVLIESLIISLICAVHYICLLVPG